MQICTVLWGPYVKVPLATGEPRRVAWAVAMKISTPEMVHPPFQEIAVTHSNAEGQGKDGIC